MWNFATKELCNFILRSHVQSPGSVKPSLIITTLSALGQGFVMDCLTSWSQLVIYFLGDSLAAMPKCSARHLDIETRCFHRGFATLPGQACAIWYGWDDCFWLRVTAHTPFQKTLVLRLWADWVWSPFLWISSWVHWLYQVYWVYTPMLWMSRRFII